ncbi:MAG TPA: uroporphyrinogen decarboxylase [Gemmatimonadota bacterium]|nr:uroporphyrinogen decarboxylase [Gemmatimonadota bacterium]
MSDRFLEACRRQPVDATPVWFMRQAGRALPEYRAVRERHALLDIVRLPELCAEVTLQPVRRLGVDAAIVFADITLPLEGLGVDFEIRAGVGPVVERPVRTPADVERLRPFEPGPLVGSVVEALGLLRRESPVPVIGFAGAPFTLAAYLIEGRPSTRFLEVKRFLHAHPAAWDDLMRRLTDATIAYLAAQAGAGAEALQLFDSWIGALAPVEYRRSVQPHVRRLFAGLPGVPTIHFGTGTAGLLPDLAAAGGDVIGLDWRIDLDRGWDLVGERAIQGNLDPAVAAVPWPALRTAADDVLARAAGRPGHVFNLGHGVLPETPVDNLRRLVDHVHEATAREAREAAG